MCAPPGAPPPKAAAKGRAGGPQNNEIPSSQSSQSVLGWYGQCCSHQWPPPCLALTLTLGRHAALQPPLPPPPPPTTTRPTSSSLMPAVIMAVMPGLVCTIAHRAGLSAASPVMPVGSGVMLYRPAGHTGRGHKAGLSASEDADRRRHDAAGQGSRRVGVGVGVDGWEWQGREGVLQGRDAAGQGCCRAGMLQEGGCGRRAQAGTHSGRRTLRPCLARGVVLRPARRQPSGTAATNALHAAWALGGQAAHPGAAGRRCCAAWRATAPARPWSTRPRRRSRRGSCCRLGCGRQRPPCLRR